MRPRFKLGAVDRGLLFFSISSAILGTEMNISTRLE